MNIQGQTLHRPSRLSDDDVEAYVQYYASLARNNFWAYRQFMDERLVKGWFPEDISRQLQLFFDKLMAGERPKMILMAPPQHGKTRNLQDFVSWVAGKAPHLKSIYASFSSDLGTMANTAIQRAMIDPKYADVFPDTKIGRENVVTLVDRPKRNSKLIEYAGHKGSFRNTTVNGQINGKTLDLGIIDDPIKGRAEASSKTKRDNAWNWFIDDFFTRFDDQAGMILTATRWHVDDPTGRFLKHFPNAIVLRYPALSAPKQVMPHDPRFRTKDMPLFPEFKSYEFLMERKAPMTIASWESLYQQNPIITGGGIFPVDRVKLSQAMPPDDKIKKVVRYWDKAGTTDDGAYTAGVLMISVEDGGWFIPDVVRGQWGAFERENIIKATAERDAERYGRMKVSIYTEQEPGSGGKESAERTIAMLAGFKVYADKVTGSKEVRADPYAGQWQGGNITLKVAPWNDTFLDEHEAFPNSKYKDQVDAAAGAFAQCVGKKYAYDTSMKWAE